MAELDLTDPSHLAELLRASLPGFDDETPERVAPLVEVLEQSDSDVFAGIGKGHRPQPPSPNQQQQQQQAPEPQPKQSKKKKKKNGDEPPVQQQAQQQPIDMGGEGLLFE